MVDRAVVDQAVVDRAVVDGTVVDGILAARLGWTESLSIQRKRTLLDGGARRLARMDSYVLSYERLGGRMRDDRTCGEEHIIELRGQVLVGPSCR